MNDGVFDPDRLAKLATPASALLREDLLAVRDLGPTKEQLRALEVAVGAAVATAAVAGVTATAAASSTAPSVGVASSTAAMSAAATVAPAAVGGSAITFGVSAALLKGGAAVLAVALSVAGGRAWIGAPSSRTGGRAPIPARASGAGPLEQARPAGPAVPRPLEDSPAPPRDPGVMAAPARATANPPAPSTEGRSMAAERRLLDRAQRALDGAPAAALAATEAHRRRFSDGALAEEREVIAVGALVSLGREDDARARAAAFAQRYPGSAYARRMRALVGSTAK